MVTHHIDEFVRGVKKVYNCALFLCLVLKHPGYAELSITLIRIISLIKNNQPRVTDLAISLSGVKVYFLDIVFFHTIMSRLRVVHCN